MGGCAAPTCSNCTEKGFKMYRFPRDPERRRIWIQNCGRENWTPGSGAYLCQVHFDENQFERLRQDNDKKLRQNSIPTIFDKTKKPKKLKSAKTKSKKVKSIRMRIRVKPLKKESSEKDDDEEMEDMEEIDEVVKEYKDTAAERQITIFKREIETLKQDVAEFEKHNKSMSQVIVELEKHNKLMGIKIVELEKENKVLTFKIGDLEKLNEDLKSKLDCCFTEEQLARMDKMKQLGTIERYIPALHQ